VIYVVAGEAPYASARRRIRSGPDRSWSVPNGTGHALERKGKNPLIVVSTLIGALCDHIETLR
jgi:hypothetical protein